MNAKSRRALEKKVMRGRVSPHGYHRVVVGLCRVFFRQVRSACVMLLQLSERCCRSVLFDHAEQPEQLVEELREAVGQHRVVEAVQVDQQHGVKASGVGPAQHDAERDGDQGHVDVPLAWGRALAHHDLARHGQGDQQADPDADAQHAQAEGAGDDAQDDGPDGGREADDQGHDEHVDDQRAGLLQPAGRGIARAREPGAPQRAQHQREQQSGPLPTVRKEGVPDRVHSELGVADADQEGHEQEHGDHQADSLVGLGWCLLRGCPVAERPAGRPDQPYVQGDDQQVEERDQNPSRPELFSCQFDHGGLLTE